MAEMLKTNSIKTTGLLLSLLTGLIIAVSAGMLLLLARGGLLWSQILGGMLSLFLISLMLLAFVTVVAFIRLWYNKTVPVWLLSAARLTLKVLYPALTGLGKLLGRNKNEVRRAYADLNNQALLQTTHTYAPEQMLILTPHCLQRSDCCIKVTNDISQCRECGACNIADLLKLKSCYGVETVIATGGTLARKRIREKKPDFIIAIACERDLISGLMDVRNIPVYAITNERPEGPCHNTRINMNEVETIIKRFIRGDEQ